MITLTIRTVVTTDQYELNCNILVSDVLLKISNVATEL